MFGEVDRLPPRRGPHLQPGHVDHLQVPVDDEEVGRLDVPVRETGVPHLAHQLKPVVDDLVGYLGMSERLGPLEERGRQQVLLMRA